MSYGDGGFYFLQPVSQPAGAYGSLGAIGKGKKFGPYQVLYQKKPYPKTHAGYKKDVADLFTAISHLKLARAQARAKIKSLRKQAASLGGNFGATWSPGGMIGRNTFARSVIPGAVSGAFVEKIAKEQDKLKLIAKAMPLALKRYSNAKNRMDAKYPGRRVILGKAPIPPQVQVYLQSLKEKTNVAEDYVEQSLIEEEQAGVTDLPEDETMIDEIVVEDGVSMAPSLFEEHKNLIYLGGAGVAAFALYKMMK